MWYLLILMDILAWSLLALWWFRLHPNPRRRPKKYRPVLNMVPLGSDFYGPLLVAGTMIGQRHFRWDGSRLTALSMCASPWKPGENIATCGGMGVTRPGHQVAQRNCSCGFYAYHTDHIHRSGGSWVNIVTGLIEGYGRVTIGSKGFRCEKARIVAFIGWRIPRDVRRAYPDVPRFRTRRFAFRRFPLSVAPETAPEATPDDSDVQAQMTQMELIVKQILGRLKKEKP